MPYTEALKDGFKLIHRNWQLIIIRVAASLVNCIGLIIFIGIPLAVAVIMFGLDLKDVGVSSAEELFSVLQRPSDFAEKYLGLFLLISVSFLIYLTLAAVVWIYVFGGSLGVIARSISEPSFKFHAGSFFSEGKRLFMPLMGYTAVIGFFFMAAVLVLGLTGGVAAVLVAYLRQTEVTLALFIGIFLSLLLIVIFLVFLFLFMALSIYGSAIVAFERPGSFRAFARAFLYLKKNPSSLWGYCLMLSGYIAAVILLALVSTPFSFIPLVGMIILIPYQFFSYTVQRYLGLVMTATVMTDYRRIRAEHAAPSSGGSTQAADTSQEETSGQSPPPLQSEQKEQA